MLLVVRTVPAAVCEHVVLTFNSLNIGKSVTGNGLKA